MQGSRLLNIKFLLGNNTVNTGIATAPFSTDLSSWITWTTPTLSNGTSFFGRTSLVTPSNLQKNLTTNVTFNWTKVNDAAKYIIQLATDPAFTTIVKSDSTSTDTLINFSGLIDGKLYYWRVRVKNSVGQFGPWSDTWNFSTYIPLPEKPQIVSSAPYQNRAGYMTLTWNKSKYADQYIVQLADVQTFTYGVTSATTSDTVKTLSGINEGVKYYWRVQANNVNGPSSWSDVSNFVRIIAPTSLTAQKSAEREITLTWTDNSSVEAGYIIERMQNPQTSFAVVDTAAANANTFVDKNLDVNITYTYRTKAYTNLGESDYSNEASLVLVGVKQEEGIPAAYSLSQNYPNPFNPSTNIKFALPKSVFTKITLYDLLGREVQTFVNNNLEAGYHEINFNAGKLTSGVYLYRIQAGDFTETKKLVLLR